jgi:hypothetical protein
MTLLCRLRLHLDGKGIPWTPKTWMYRCERCGRMRWEER